MYSTSTIGPARVVSGKRKPRSYQRTWGCISDVTAITGPRTITSNKYQGILTHLPVQRNKESSISIRWPGRVLWRGTFSRLIKLIMIWNRVILARGGCTKYASNCEMYLLQINVLFWMYFWSVLVNVKAWCEQSVSTDVTIHYCADCKRLKMQWCETHESEPSIHPSPETAYPIQGHRGSGAYRQGTIQDWAPIPHWAHSHTIHTLLRAIWQVQLASACFWTGRENQSAWMTTRERHANSTHT